MNVELLIEEVRRRNLSFLRRRCRYCCRRNRRCRRRRCCRHRRCCCCSVDLCIKKTGFMNNDETKL